MVRNEVGRHAQGVAELTVALDAFHEQIDDAQAVGFGQYLSWRASWSMSAMVVAEAIKMILSDD